MQKTPLYEVASQIGEAPREVRDIAKTKLGLRSSLTFQSNLTEAEVHTIRQHYGKPSYYREPTGPPSTVPPMNVSYVADDLNVTAHTLILALEELGIKGSNLTAEQIGQVREYFKDRPPHYMTPEQVQTRKAELAVFAKNQKELEAQQRRDKAWSASLNPEEKQRLLVEREADNEAESERQNARLNWLDEHAPEDYGTDDGEQSLSIPTDQDFENASQWEEDRLRTLLMRVRMRMSVSPKGRGFPDSAVFSTISEGERLNRNPQSLAAHAAEI
jgi:hypothetical protein